MARVRAVGGEVAHEITDWLVALTPAGACASPAQARELTDWLPARAPGTTAQALAAAGRWTPGAPLDLTEQDVWWRAQIAPGGAGELRFDGLATLAEAWLDETPLFASRSMYAPQVAPLPAGASGVLWICFRALAMALSVKAPRARWRPFMITHQGLRQVRTTLLPYMPGWRPAVDVVGPWRPVRRVEHGALRVRAASMRPAVGANGPELHIALELDGADEPPVVSCAGAEARLAAVGQGHFTGMIHAPEAALWWPHSHGPPALHAVHARVGDQELDLGRTGFRTLAVDRGEDGRGFGLTVNGVPVFCRGAAWVNPDPVALGASREAYAPALTRMREAGMNMVRVAGVGVYEAAAFHELCNELGLLVWQDFMFANFDYPAQDPAFLQTVREEAEAVLDALEASPSLAVLCGGSEVFQQAAMMGLAPQELVWPLFDEVLAEVVARRRPDVAYVPNTPWGGALPFVADAGVTHYYGVGAYQRPLEDVRRAGVRFATECLAFANVPSAESLAATPDAPALHDARWKARTPRDRGASWDFEDVRDHYLARVFERDPAPLRREDPDLYLDLSRAVSGEVMAQVFAEWRRAGSTCRGGLVWHLQDAEMGAGWGVIDAAGAPKPAWWPLARVLRPLQVLLTDEGVNGLAVHLLNETAAPVEGELRLVVWGEEGAAMIDVRRPAVLPARSAATLSAFELIGRFFDLTCAYRFGPRSHAAVGAELRAPDGALLTEAIYVPPGVEAWGEGAIRADVLHGPDGWRLRLTADRLQRFVRIADAAYEPLDDWLALPPGEPREVRLRPRDPACEAPPAGALIRPGGAVAGVYPG